VRFLNAPLAALLVWCTYLFCRSGYPDRRDLHLGVPLLVAFMPFDPWYAINSDAIAPLLSVITLLAILRWYRESAPTVAHSLAVGFLVSLSVLLKYTHVAIPLLFVALSLWKLRTAFRDRSVPRRVTGLCGGILCAMVPILLYMARNYALFGDGINRVALLDPFSSVADALADVGVMNEIETIPGPTSDPKWAGPDYPNAVYEWCINAAAVDPLGKSVLINSEDGRLYRWDLMANRITEGVLLDGPRGQAYTPTVVGPTGIVYAINNARLFAVGK
jgi:hypothetical protein